MVTKYIQNGENLDYLNTTEEKILAGDVVSLVTRVGVAGCDIAPGKVGSVAVVGVFAMPKSGKTEIPMGTALFWDGAGISNSEEGNIPAGYATDTAAADATLVKVKLLG